MSSSKNIYRFVISLFLIFVSCTTQRETVSGNSAENFKAYYTKLDSGAAWEADYRMGEHADLMVEFSATEKLYFWRASSYLPRWETGQGVTYFEQAPFTFSGDGSGLQWDKLSRHSHVRLISADTHQAIVHWRYAPIFETETAPETPFWDGWVDEYYTIRPDKTVTREIYDYDEGVKHTYDYQLNSDGTLSETATNDAAFTKATPAYVGNNRLPSGPDLEFGATYTNLGFDGNWYREDAPFENWSDNWQVGEHPDVVVNFDDSATKWVFWRGASFVPHMVSDNDIWYTNEFNEMWGLNWEGTNTPDYCITDLNAAEPMNDKAARYSHARIIENTPARAVVHFRISPPNVCANLGAPSYDNSGWFFVSDFYYYIYPDGAVVQYNTLWTVNDPVDPEEQEAEFQESIVTHHPGTGADDNIEANPSVWFGNLAGQFASTDHETTVTTEIEPFDPGVPNASIQVINLKGTDTDPFTIVEHGPDIGWIAGGLDSELNDAYFAQYQHWPVNEYNTHAVFSPDNTLTSHTPLTNIYNWPLYDSGSNFFSRVMLTGVKDLSQPDLTALARSWDTPPTLTVASGGSSQGYDKAQRAYMLTSESPALTLEVEASAENPLFNPSFVVKNWDSTTPATVQLNGNILTDGIDYKQGIALDTDGTEMLVLWLDDIRTEPVTLTVAPAIPTSLDMQNLAIAEPQPVLWLPTLLLGGLSTWSLWRALLLDKQIQDHSFW